MSKRDFFAGFADVATLNSIFDSEESNNLSQWCKSRWFQAPGVTFMFMCLLLHKDLCLCANIYLFNGRMGDM